MKNKTHEIYTIFPLTLPHLRTCMGCGVYPDTILHGIRHFFIHQNIGGHTEVIMGIHRIGHVAIVAKDWCSKRTITDR